MYKNNDMPLISLDRVGKDTVLGLWRIDESVDDFLRMGVVNDSLLAELDTMSSIQRRREVIAVRALLNRIFGYGVAYGHNENGKPCLDNGYNVSVSHSKNIVSVIVSPQNKVAVDVEYVSRRVERVAGRLLRPDEHAETLMEKLLHWCTKETLYKLYSEEHLSLTDIRVLSIDGDSVSGTVSAKNVQRFETLNVDYCISDGFVLTYVVL